MLTRLYFLLLILPICTLAPTIETSAQESLEKYAYRSPDQRRVFRIHDNKKLNDKEILELMKDDVIAQDKFKKSMKLKRAAWITGGAFLGIATYVATQEDIKNNTFGDYNTGQKAVFIGYVATATGFAYSLVGNFLTRSKSISRVCFPCKEKELGHHDEQLHDFFAINYYGSSIGLSYNF